MKGEFDNPFDPYVPETRWERIRHAVLIIWHKWKPLKRCEVCGKLMIHRKFRWCCSKECLDNWLPF